MLPHATASASVAVTLHMLNAGAGAGVVGWYIMAAPTDERVLIGKK